MQYSFIFIPRFKNAAIIGFYNTNTSAGIASDFITVE
ncbi:hypothetical protein [Escherichia phage dw-ec]|nr:hypothetical protein [Escherichia phage BI-EHEC]UJQ43856.1 hypothetical protein [Escherichia phage dw-ec]